jgi:hypothetical protein
VLAGDRKVGQVEITRREVAGITVETETLVLELGAPGRRVSYRVVQSTESAADGALLRSAREVKTREGHFLVEARVAGDDLEVANGAGRAKSSQKLAGAARALKSDAFCARVAGGGGTRREPDSALVSVWDPVKLAVVEVTLRRLADTDALLAGAARALFESADGFRAADRTPQGTWCASRCEWGRSDLVLVESSEAEARAKNEVPGSRLAAAAEGALPHPDEGHANQDPLWLRQSRHCAAVASRRRSAHLGPTVKLPSSRSVPNAFSIRSRFQPGDRERALQPTRWVQSDDPRLAQRARGLAAGARDDAARMKRLTAFVRGHMSVETHRHAGLRHGGWRPSTRGAATAPSTRLLLAALGRAAGIPTRVAVGSVYARHFEGHNHVFVPHAWVQAWTGSGWQSFDAAIGSFDSTHLAFAVSYDGSPANHFAGASLAHELKLTSAARVVPRKSAGN